MAGGAERTLRALRGSEIFMGSRDGRQFSIEHARESEQIVALVLQRNAHRAKPSHAPGLATHKLHDDEVEQHLPRGQTDHID
jgi:hypothetical protein